jgi:predicted Zn-dependent peptidase
MRNDDVPCSVAEAESRQALYADPHPYRRAPFGVADSVERVGLEEVRRYVQTEYVPQRAAVFLVGDITPQDALARVTKWFGDIPPGQQAWAPQEELLPTSGTRVVVRANVDAPRIRITWRIPRALDDAFQWEAFGHLLDGEEVALLVWKFRDELKLAPKVSASYNRRKLGSVFQIEATVAPGHDPDELIAKVDDFLAKILDAERGRFMWAAEEVARSRAFEGETTAGRAERLAGAWVRARPEDDPAALERFDAATVLRLVGLALVRPIASSCAASPTPRLRSPGLSCRAPSIAG